ncbi:hypothetical protein A3K86_16725 [Photobacterium jeanii]|uniref:DUF4381 domain-containing protein n=1 Tax=Photobacterium jeanii TaxID=858640 RepID=A0A178K8B4_9GAMM|nr:DUF4381 domain-containing protein [Photobacterium jeanii]OAN13296.1 hypothetical protein A3K86_16725 [Photobacterium jeanii]PST90296.1 DUF4381 domain-containing protein [Photobacterium jeanii]
MSIHTPPSTYILRDMIDVAVPDSVSWWPQTHGWQLLALLAMVAALAWCYRRINHWWHNRYRREAIQALQKIPSSSPHDSAQLLLLILKAVLVYLNPKNAALFGEALLQKLDSLLPQDAPHQAQFQYHSELGRKWLAATLSQQSAITDSEMMTLLTHTRSWLVEHQDENAIRGVSSKPSVSLLTRFRNARLRDKPSQGAQR